MKLFSLEAQAALASGDVLTSGAVKIAAADPVLVWGGYGNIVLGGEAYIGVGDKGMVDTVSGSIGATAQGATLSLSGVDPDLIPLMDLRSLRGCPAVLWRLVFNGSGARLLHPAIFMRGSIDRAEANDTPGGSASIVIGVEGAARSLGRRSQRMRTDADQRLVSSTDGGFKAVTYAGDKQIYAGGKPPQRATSTFGGYVYGGGGGGGGNVRSDQV